MVRRTLSSSTSAASSLLLLFLCSIPPCTKGLDLQFNKISCDESLPAYASGGEMTVTCGGESRCTFGDTALISGLLHYVDMEENGLSNTTGYASADLQLMTLEYELFQLLPFNFCGDFIKRSAYNFNYCPQNGKYHFEVPYTLPQQHDDYATWFASGWAGTSYLSIHTARDADSPLLAHCKLEFKTFVTQSNESGWQTLPSAAVVTLILAGIVACMFSMLCFMACQPRKKHVTDDIYENEFRALEEESPQQAEMTAKIKSNNKNKRKSTLQVQADSDWLPLGDADWAPESPQGKALQAAVGMKTPQEP